MSLGSAFNVSRVAVPSRGFCFLRMTCQEKSYVSRVAVPSRGSCLPRKTCPAKNFISWVGYIGIGSFPFLCPLILKGRSWDPRQKSGPHISKKRTDHGCPEIFIIPQEELALKGSNGVDFRKGLWFVVQNGRAVGEAAGQQRPL